MSRTRDYLCPASKGTRGRLPSPPSLPPASRNWEHLQPQHRAGSEACPYTQTEQDQATGASSEGSHGAIPVLAVPGGQVCPALPLPSQEHLWSHSTCPIWGGPDEGGQHLHRGSGVGICSQPLLHLLLKPLGHLQEGLIGEPHMVQVFVDLKDGDKAQRSGGGLGTWAQAP